MDSVSMDEINFFIWLHLSLIFIRYCLDEHGGENVPLFPQKRNFSVAALRYMEKAPHACGTPFGAVV
jgi:hypothetical protein